MNGIINIKTTQATPKTIVAAPIANSGFDQKESINQNNATTANASNKYNIQASSTDRHT